MIPLCCSVVTVFVLFLVASLPSVHAQAAGTDSSGTAIHPGAVEIGIGGSLVVVSGITNARFVVRGGSFVTAPGGLAGVELGLAYAHVSLLDRFDVDSRICWLFALERSSIVPSIGIGGGIRQEWMGTFSQLRYPMGGGVGIRGVVGSDVVIRSEYLYRYIAGDPVANYSEHTLEFGLSLLLANTGDSMTGATE